MANPERGEMTLVCGEQTLVLRMTTNACCELEALSGKSFEEHIRDWDTLRRVTSLRWLVWASLQDKHAAMARTPELVGPILDACDRQSVTKVMANFIALNSAEVRKLIAAGLLSEEKKSGPSKAQATDGVDSTSMLVGSV